MKVRKAIKKIAAIGAGATMLGATLMGAMAADLNEYPGLFITDGQFDGYLVVGAKANTIDTIGMTNIALGLQNAAVSTTVVCEEGTSAASKPDTGVQIDKSSTHMNYGTSIQEVENTLDDTDLPDVLADGTYEESRGNTDNDEDYTQKLEFTANTGAMVFFQDKDIDEAGTYLYFDDDASNSLFAYTYVLEFDNPVDYDEDEIDDDLEGTSLEIQGKDYTITDVSLDTNDIIQEITLMSGESAPTWVSQGATITKDVDGVEHTITMRDVTDDDANDRKCGLEVDGSSITWIQVGTTEKVSGVVIGVTDANAVYSKDLDQDICEIYVGAEELVLSDGDEVSIGGDDIDGSEVTLSGPDDSAINEWTGITITWVPDEAQFLAADEKLVDPVFGNFQFYFGGVSKTTEEIKVDVGGDDGTLTFPNSDGKTVTIPLFWDESDVIFGEGDDVSEALYYDDNNVCTGTGAVTDCEGSKWLFVVNNEAHVVEITDIDINNNDISFHDVTYDSDDDEQDYNNDGSETDDIYLSDIGTIRVTVDEGADSVTINAGDLGVRETIETEYGAMITTLDEEADGNVTIVIEENDDSSIAAADETTATLTIGFDASDDMQINDLTLSADTYYGCDSSTDPLDAGGNGCDESESNDEDVFFATKYGSIIQYDQEDMLEFNMAHPDDWVEGDVYISPTSAAIVEGEGTCSTQSTINKIPSTVNKFDTEIGSDYLTSNVISIGGPCANSVSSALLGSPEICWEGFEAGKSIIQLFENGDNVAMLVAGASGKDTRAASKILQDYESYDSLTGTKVTAITSSMQVEPWSAPIVEEEEEADDNETA